MKKPRKSDEEKRAVVMAYRPIDDAFFEKVVEDPKVLEEMLQVFLDNPKLRIKPETVVAQKSIRNLQGRSIRADAYAEGQEDIVFNVEIQRANNCNHLKRMRYIASLITANRSEPGDAFDDVQEVYVIYVSETDILETRQTLTHIDKVIRETGTVVNDGLHEILVNAEVPSDTKASRYMDEFIKPHISSDEFINLKNRVNGIKSDEKEVNMMCKSVEAYAEKRAKEAVNENIINSIRNLATNGASIELVIASFPDVSKDDVQAIFDSVCKKES